MRVRIRGPSGQSTMKLSENATIDDLRKIIIKETSLPDFEIKYGYPPKALDLEGYPLTQPLSHVPIKLDGEQLIVNRKDGSTNVQHPVSPAIVTQPSDNRSTGKPLQNLKSSLEKGSEPTTSNPLSFQRKQNPEMDDPPELFMPEVGGTLVLRIMPDDNSCLFRAVSSAVMSDTDAVTELRSIVAEVIQNDKITYSKAVLDNKEPDTYCRWIKSSDSWGGQVELVILSQYFHTEICSIDVQTLRVDKYNEGAERRCIVVYSGIHYDTIALSLVGSGPDEDVKLFESHIKDEILPQAVNLCKRLQEKHYFTDTSGFKIKCNVCGATCTGERGATEHATNTGHYDFGESA